MQFMYKVLSSFEVTLQVLLLCLDWTHRYQRKPDGGLVTPQLEAIHPTHLKSMHHQIDVLYVLA